MFVDEISTSSYVNSCLLRKASVGVWVALEKKRVNTPPPLRHSFQWSRLCHGNEPGYRIWKSICATQQKYLAKYGCIVVMSSY